MDVTDHTFGETPDGRPVHLFTCTNRDGLELRLINYGATITSMSVPDRQGDFANIVLGLPSLDGYLGPHPYLGSTVGRFANRIANGRFAVDGQEVVLEQNNGPNHLHGGRMGFSRVVWEAEPFSTGDEAGVIFTRTSPHGEDGYPGTVEAEVIYALSDAGELRMAYTATADQATPINLTNHAYWNLGGGDTVLDHLVSIQADHYLPVDATQIPTGEIAPVAGTPMDFTAPKVLGRDLEEVPGDRLGYDHCFVLRHPVAVAKAARVEEPTSGRVMEVATSQPGLQLYSGNNLNGSPAHGGYQQFAGMCLEAQHYPDSPNQPQFPTVMLHPGERYAQLTIHRFFTN